MAKIDGYFERVRGIEDTFPSQESALRRSAVKILSFLAAVEIDTFKSFPVVDSPEVMWSQGSREDLENELKEILDEPKSVS